MRRARSFLGFLLLLSSSSLTRAETTSTLTVHVSTFRSTHGALVCRLFAGPDGFPSKATKRPLIGPPSWSDARFHLSRAATLSIDLHY
jgi:uncharacterized protein (DUF2141 family)